MKVRLKRTLGLPQMQKGYEFCVDTVTESGTGEKIYFVHYCGAIIGVREKDCEEIEGEEEEG